MISLYHTIPVRAISCIGNIKISVICFGSAEANSVIHMKSEADQRVPTEHDSFRHGPVGLCTTQAT